MFYMNMKAFNEGEQAEAYKKRKEEEKAKERKETDDRLKGRYRAFKDKDGHTGYLEPGRKMTKQNPNFGIKHPIKSIKGAMEDNKFEDAVKNKTMQFDKEENGRKYYKNKKEYDIHGTTLDVMNGSDAINRHFRRHPEKLKENCGIFDCLEML